ncbi:MAG: O-methyltransferase [Chloroflexi bacterium]|nr:O-methyltransferase [Chloroflexota bacterium]MYE27715.1 O-methyltransferase [Chloroflexota bacterium]
MSQSLSPRYSEYVNELFTREDKTLRHVREQTSARGIPLISLEPNEAKLLQMLVRLCGAERVVEVGTLAGYSGICIARALPAHGRLITIEVSSVHAEVARAHFEYAGLADKVTVLQGAGLEVLPKLASDGPFDLMFIDADKASYPSYLEWAAHNLRVGGAVVADNVFWQGQIFDPKTEDDHGVVNFNQTLAQHPQFDSAIIEVGDGIALGVKTS